LSFGDVHVSNSKSVHLNPEGPSCSIFQFKDQRGRDKARDLEQGSRTSSEAFEKKGFENSK